MRAKQVMSTEVVTISPGHSVWHAAQIMLASDVSGLPVVDDEGHPVGVITEGDLLHRCELGAHWPSRDDGDTDEAMSTEFIRRFAWSVADVMSRDVVHVAEDRSLGEIAALMSLKRVKRVLVLRDGALVGIVSRRDLLRTIAERQPGEAISGDDRIRLSVLARLREVAGLLGELPEITVQNCVVTCRGAARSELAREVVRVVVEGVPGSAGLDDQMRLDAIGDAGRSISECP